MLLSHSPNFTHLILAKHLVQVEQSHPPVPVQIFSQAKPKEPPNDALPNFLKVYKSCTKVGVIAKEKHTGKVIDDWEKSLKEQSVKVETVDVSHCISSFMAVKDDEELVSSFPSTKVFWN